MATKLFFTRKRGRYSTEDPTHVHVFFSVDEREEWEARNLSSGWDRDDLRGIPQDQLTYALKTVYWSGREMKGAEGIFHVHVPEYDESGDIVSFHDVIRTLPKGGANEGMKAFLKELRALAPSTKPEHIRVAFDGNGNHEWAAWGKDIHWEIGTPFEDILTFDHFGEGFSSIQAVFRNSAGQLRTMFLSDFEEVIPKLVDGKLTGKFEYRRMGNRTGCRLKT